jgi:hypothetical protein
MYSSSLVLIILAAGIAMSLVLAFLANRATQLNRSIRKQMVFTALLSSGLLALALGYLVVRIHTPTPASPQTPTVCGNVTFSAPWQTKELMNVPFEVSSGPVNVGCDEARHIEIPFHIPVQNATLGDIHTQWVNTDNLVSTTAHFEQRSPTDLVAVGDIRGIARNFIFNCPGGGHGTLAMQGAYSYQKETRGPEAVVSTVHESVPIGSRFTVAIPPIPVDESLKSDVVVVSKDGTSHLVGTISSPHPDIFNVRQQSGTIDLKPSIEHGFLILQF